MRFLHDGPSIPDHLLNLRDQGKVVFICGAGVSVPADMPDFRCLTKHVLDTLRVPMDSPVAVAFQPWTDKEKSDTPKTPLDQIFNALQQEYGKDQVGKVVAERLAIPPTAVPQIRQHQIIARISADRAGIPQIVTTNFDLLFEQPGVTSNAQIFEPPTFPNLRHNRPITGITYLHGRLKAQADHEQDYILSSADFGRAYLAEGWATQFVSTLLQQYTVVLLGYQANDPPVSYLLQGLNASSRLHSGRLFAFDRGQPDEIEAKWRDRGVTPIPYQGDGSHSALWDSLEAWSIRAIDPIAWRASIVSLARQKPSTLHPHERGMVAHIARTTLGAKALADSKPCPPAEWLCVFDSNYRMTKPKKGSRPDSQPFDPAAHFGLDDDPPRELEDDARRGQKPTDLISWLPVDESPTEQFRLSGRPARDLGVMPPRLFHLARWIANVAEDPVTAWWAARQNGLHPRLWQMLANKFESKDGIPAPGRQLWGLILEHLDNDDLGLRDIAWLRTRKRIEVEGWSTSILRAIEKSTEPVIVVRRPDEVEGAQPPNCSWVEVERQNIAQLEVSFQGREHYDFTVPDEVLPQLFLAISRNMLRGAECLAEADRTLRFLPTLYREESDRPERHTSDAGDFLAWFVELLERMAIVAPNIAAATISSWPMGEPCLLDKIRLYAWNKAGLFDGRAVSYGLLSLPRDVFWFTDHRRELLFLLRDRWSEFDEDSQSAVEKLILDGPGRSSLEQDEDNRIANASASASYLGWLISQGCSVSVPSRQKLDSLTATIPDWNEAWATTAADSLETKSGWVGVEKSPSKLIGVPIQEIVEVALDETHHDFLEFTEHRPFSGLVTQYPGIAISALGAAARRGEYPESLWQTLINEWPTAVPPRASTLFYERLRRLPVSSIVGLRYDIGAWLRDNLAALAAADERYALALFDDLINKYAAAGADATESALGETYLAGEPVHRSRKTIDHAINGPIGHATEALLKVLKARNLGEGDRLPPELSKRFERLLKLPGEGAGHAVSLLSREADWLYYIDPDWASAKMLPWFSLDCGLAESAWNGLLSARRIALPSLFAQLKADFLKLFQHMYGWQSDTNIERCAHEWLVMVCIWHVDEPKYLSYNDTASVMRDLRAEGRVDVINHLARVGKDNDDGWEDVVVPFLINVWPKENRYQIESSSAAFLSLLEDTEDNLPKVLPYVQNFLRPLYTGYNSFSGFYRDFREGKEPLAKKFPEESLDIMDKTVPNDPHIAPHDMELVLELIAEVRPKLSKDPRFIRLTEIAAAR